MGDALKAVFEARAHSLPTSGKDGSIDAWIERARSGPNQIFELSLPAIVECKDHDDNLKNLSRNVQQGWAKVAETLTINAESGWTGSFRPWKTAKSYLYCVSCVFPDYQSKLDLEQKILRFFHELPPDNRPPIEYVRVVDWTDLRPWLDQLQIVSDQWLGISLDLVLPLDEYIARLSGFQDYLQEDVLPFVPPPQDSPFHPEQVLRHLVEAAGTGGVLLHGPGGIGKTRISLEVARRAASDGWRVLYLSPGEPGVDVDTLAEAVLSVPGKTLILSDYLDQAHRLDLGAVRRTLIPQAMKRGVEVALLATSRPGWLLANDPDRDALFRKQVAIELPDDHRDAIADRVLDFAAPDAVATLGREELRRICGDRPILVLLIAREVEQQVRRDTWEPADANARQGDLLYWLRRRLAQDHIMVAQPASPLEPAKPEPEVTAVATVLACCPQSRFLLVDAAQHALDTLGAGGAEKADHIVSTLTQLGWIEMREGQFATAHDVVADDVLDQTLFGTGAVRHAELAAVLSIGCSSARSFGRLATSVQRLVTGVDEANGKLLEKALGAWLSEHAGLVGKSLAEDDADVASYAIGATLNGVPWSTLMIGAWDVIVSPWLYAHGRSIAARHLYYRGLRVVSSGAANELVDSAIRWLDAHPALPEAGFVLAPLLARSDLEAEEARRAIAAGSQWLEEYPTVIEAQFVLAQLLARSDLEAEEARGAVSAGFQWLKEHPTLPEANFVLAQLLARHDLTAEEVRGAVSAGFQWLKEHPALPEAGFVLAPLLARSDLEAEEARRAIAAGSRWLKEYPTVPEAQFVLAQLLARSDLETEEARGAVSAGFQWLKEHPTLPEANFVLAQLLARHDLTAEEVRGAVSAGFQWLKEHPTFVEAGFVFPPLLARSDLKAEEARIAIAAGLRWLADHAATEDAEFVLRDLFRRPEPSSKDRSRVAIAAIQRLQAVLHTSEATFLLRTLLEDRHLNPELNIQVVELGVEWLDAHPADPAADFVFNRILRIPHVDDTSWIAAAGHAFEWLEAKSRHENPDDRVLFSLATRPELLSDRERTYIADESLKCSGSSQYVNRLLLRVETIVRDNPAHPKVLHEIKARGLIPD